MQAQTIPISINTANAGPAPARGPAADNAAEAGTPFREALSREIGQRKQAGEASTASAPAQDAATVPATRAPDAAADSRDAATAAEEAAVNPVTDMLALAASLATPTAPVAAGAAAASTAPSEHPDPATEMGTDPIFARKTGTDPITGAGSKMGSVPISGADSEAALPLVPASPESAKFAQAFSQAAQAMGAGTPVRPVAEGAAQLRNMFATAATQVSQAPGAAVSDEVALQGGLVAGVSAQPVAGRPAAQAAQAMPQQASDAKLDLAALAAAGAGDTPAEPAAAEAPAQNASFSTQLQAARMEQVQANPMAAADRLPARVGTPAWDRQLGQKIVFMAAGAEQSASLTLNPPDLGPVQVVLNISNDQASVAFSSQQLEVRQALENAMPKLREMMGESGITLGNATVNAGMPEQQQQAQRGQDAGAGGHNGNGRGGNGGSAGGDDAAPAPVVRRVSNGVVDTFA